MSKKEPTEIGVVLIGSFFIVAGLVVMLAGIAGLIGAVIWIWKGALS